MYDYAIVYLSETGSADILAHDIYEYLPEETTVLVNLHDNTEVPEANFYFVGFDIRNDTCNVEVLNLLSNLDSGFIALFATCLQPITNELQCSMEKKFNLWVPYEEQYAGMYLCQSRMPKAAYAQCRVKIQAALPPEQAEKALQQLQHGQSHPNDEDRAGLLAFVESVLQLHL